MPGKPAISLEEILNHPTVKKATDDINAEMLERRAESVWKVWCRFCDWESDSWELWYYRGEYQV